MKHSPKPFLLLFFLFVNLVSYAQSINNCDTIYNSAEAMPHYKRGEESLMEYFGKNLSGVLSDCIKRDSIVADRASILLTIDRSGNVAYVEFPGINAASYCKEKLREEILKMQGWSPGLIESKAVCSKYLWQIGCILWK